MRISQLAVLGVALATAACAAAVPGYQPPDPKIAKYREHIDKGGGFDGGGGYRLTEQEQKLDCKQLSGSITIKILQMRDADSRAKPSAAASFAQKTARPLVGGTTYGENVEADKRRDRIHLEALNGQLAQKKCPTFDLAAELAPGNGKPPRPIKPAAKARS